MLVGGLEMMAYNKILVFDNLYGKFGALKGNMILHLVAPS